MTEVTGWNTIGVTNLSVLVDGRFNLQFTGLDGEKRNIFIPGPSVPMLVAGLTTLAAQQAEGRVNIGDPVPQSHFFWVKALAVATDAEGSEFALIITTSDGLPVRFLLNANGAETLANALVGSLSKHGIDIQRQRPEETRH
jgi:hypothetical protein